MARGARRKASPPAAVAVFVTAALVLVVLAGCVGGGGAGGDATVERPGNLPTLPKGLEMEGAEVVSYTNQSVIWEWTTSMPAGAFSPEPGVVGGQVQTTLDIPSKIPYALDAHLTWDAPTLPQLYLRVEDADGTRICAIGQSLAHEEYIACQAPMGVGAPTGPATVLVQNTANANQDMPITLRLTITTGPAGAHPTLPDSSVAAEQAPTVVMAFTDTGINPYHEEFRDASPNALIHPSTHIEGYPTTARALNLSLEAPTLVEALGADAATWATVEPDVLYWIPGTRIIGAIMPDPIVLDQYAGLYCETHIVLDCNEHGTSVASRGAGATLGACPECKIVSVQGIEGGLAWATEQSWIDVTSNSWGHGVERFERAEAQEMMAKKPAFILAGNGIENAGIVGIPSTAWPYQSAPDAIVVGGHDNGRITAWPGSVPRIVSDTCVQYALHTSLSDSSWVCATSLSTPGAAGTGARVLLEARGLLDDDTGGVHDGVLARGDRPDMDSGPLADGELTNDEYRRLLYATADPRPSGDPGSPTCDPTTGRPLCLLAPTLPVEWQTIPDEVPRYYFIGYGAVNNDTLEHAKAVLRGEEPMPERPVEDAFFALDQEVRKALVEADP